MACNIPCLFEVKIRFKGMYLVMVGWLLLLNPLITMIGMIIKGMTNDEGGNFQTLSIFLTFVLIHLCTYMSWVWFAKKDIRKYIFVYDFSKIFVDGCCDNIYMIMYFLFSFWRTYNNLIFEISTQKLDVSVRSFTTITTAKMLLIVQTYNKTYTLGDLLHYAMMCLVMR